MASADPLAALRDIHLPPVPLFDGSGMVAAALAGFVCALAVAAALFAQHRRGALRRAALAALDASAVLPAEERLLAQARLLRRIVRSKAGDAAGTARGEDWLRRLDALFKAEFFSRGRGRAYGDRLYARAGVPNVEALDDELRRLIGRLR